jgi:hypothetical protein
MGKLFQYARRPLLCIHICFPCRCYYIADRRLGEGCSCRAEPGKYQGNSSSYHLFCMCKSFEYVHRPLFHAQVCFCCCGCCSWWPPTLRRRLNSAEPRSLTAHPLATMHLDVQALLPHAQIIRICPPSFVSCWGMHLLSWWCCCRTTQRTLARLPACDRSPAHHTAPGRLATSPACSNTPVCPPIDVSCPGMLLLLWL